MGIAGERVKMKHSQLLPVFVLLSLHASSVFSLSFRCGGPDRCKPGVHGKQSEKCYVCEPLVSADCKSKEILHGYCGCPVCAVAKGEPCNYLTQRVSCASNLTCYKEKDAHDYADGVCVEKKEKKPKKNAFK